MAAVTDRRYNLKSERVSAGLSNVQPAAGENAQPEHAGDAAEDRNSQRARNADGRGIVGLAPVDGANDTEVVVNRYHYANYGYKREAVIAAIDRALVDDGFEQEEFAEEPGQRRDAGQRNHGEAHRRRQQRRALA